MEQSILLRGEHRDSPVYFIQGENDYLTSFQACKEYYEQLKAPEKHLFKIKNCAHNSIVEASDQIDDILLENASVNQ